MTPDPDNIPNRLTILDMEVTILRDELRQGLSNVTIALIEHMDEHLVSKDDLMGLASKADLTKVDARFNSLDAKLAEILRRLA